MGTGTITAASMDADALVGLLQLADGLFPAGAYAHSFGLETCVQEGQVRDTRGVAAFLRVLLEQSAGSCDAVAVTAAVRAAREPGLKRALEIDEALDAMKPAAELREASRQMGRQTLRVTARQHPDAAVARLFEAVERHETPGHHALAFGLAAAAAGAGAGEAAAAFLYSTAAAVTGAALRLLPIGQLEAQGILAAQRPALARLAAAASERPLDEACAFAPALEIAAMRHARLDARLFRS
jgi:urease accessory protein